MKLIVIGSGSSGNTYLLENETECLVIEAGLPFKEVKKALSFDILKIVGVIGSHVHADHMGYAEEYLKCGIPVYASEQTHKSLSKQYDNQIVVRCGYWYQIGGFNITPFECHHDVECYGFIVRHEEIGTLLFATDTNFIKQNFKKIAVNHILIECNYSQEIIDSRVESGETIQGLRDRVLKSHMELETTKGFIKANKTPNLDSVLLLHLSEGNSNPEQFQKEVQAVVGEGVRVVVADKGVTVNLDICPF